MLLFRVYRISREDGFQWVDPPEPLEIFHCPLDRRVAKQQAQHRKRVESVKNGLHQLAEKMRMPG